MKTLLTSCSLAGLLGLSLPVHANSVEIMPPNTIRAPLAPALKAAQIQLNAAQNKWRRTQPAHYRYTLQNSCFCPPEYLKPIMIRAFKGKVQQATLLPDNKPLPTARKAQAVPIEGLFNIVQTAINRRAYSIKATYHQRYGYPVSVSIDYDPRIADEETYFSTRDFQVASGLKPAKP